MERLAKHLMVTVAGIAAFVSLLTITEKTLVYLYERNVEAEILDARYSDDFWKNFSNKEYEVILKIEDEIYTVYEKDAYYVCKEKIGDSVNVKISKIDLLDLLLNIEVCVE